VLQVYVSNRVILTWQRVLQLSSVAVDDVLFSCSNDDQLHGEYVTVELFQAGSKRAR